MPASTGGPIALVSLHAKLSKKTDSTCIAWIQHISPDLRMLP